MNAKNPMTIAYNLGLAIWQDLWPHQDLERKYPSIRYQDKDLPSADVRVQTVTVGSDVKHGDLILIAEPASSIQARFLHTHTVREAVDEPWTRLARVESATAKTLTIRMLTVTPLSGWDVDLECFGDPQVGAEVTRIRLSASSRVIGRLGSIQDVRQRITKHHAFGEWREAYTRAATVHAENLARAQAHLENQQAQWRPVEVAVQRLNEVTGEDLACFVYGDVQLTVPWLADAGRLRTYLAGLHAVGQLTDAVLTEAYELAETIGY